MYQTTTFLKLEYFSSRIMGKTEVEVHWEIAFRLQRKIIVDMNKHIQFQLNKIISRAITQLRCQGNARTLLILTYLSVGEGEVPQC